MTHVSLTLVMLALVLHTLHGFAYSLESHQLHVLLDYGIPTWLVRGAPNNAKCASASCLACEYRWCMPFVCICVVNTYTTEHDTYIRARRECIEHYRIQTDCTLNPEQLDKTVWGIRIHVHLCTHVYCV